MARYCGESARSIFTRGLENEENLNSRKRGQPLADHNNKFHSDKTLTMRDFKVEVTGHYIRPLPRLVAEGHQIDNIIDKRAHNPDNTILMNSKSNYHQAKQIRVKAYTQDY